MANKTSNKDGAKNTPAPPGDHNFASQVEVINTTCTKLYDLETQEEALIAKYLKPLREEKREVKQTMKAKTEIDIKYFNTVLYKPYKAQEDVKKFEPEDRKKAQTDIAVLYDAAGQGSMLEALAETIAENNLKAKKAANESVDVKSPANLPGDDAEETSEPEEDGTPDETSEETTEELTEDAGDDSEPSEEDQL